MAMVDACSGWHAWLDCWCPLKPAEPLGLMCTCAVQACTACFVPGPLQSAALCRLHVSVSESGMRTAAHFVLSSLAPDATCCQEAASRLLCCSLPLLPAALLPNHKAGL